MQTEIKPDPGTMWTELLSIARSASQGVAGLSAWRELHAGLPTTTAPFDRAVLAGAQMDRLGYAFLSGYHEALKQLLSGYWDLGENLAAFCVTEAGGAHPRAIRTTLAQESPEGRWRVSGEKTFVTMGGSTELLVIVACTGVSSESEEGTLRKALNVVVLPSSREGISLVPLPETPFIPEVGHARLVLSKVEVAPSEILPGDGYENFLKPFRTIEDIHVHGAILGYLLRLAFWAGVGQPGQGTEMLQEILHCIYSLRGIAGASPTDPLVHVLLGGALQTITRLVGDLVPLLSNLPPSALDRFVRDRPLFQVAGNVRMRRSQSAWERLLSGTPAQKPLPG